MENKNNYIGSIQSPVNNSLLVESVGGTYKLKHKEYKVNIRNALAFALIKSTSYEWGTGTLSIVTSNKSNEAFPICKVGILVSSYDSVNLNVNNAEYAYIKFFTPSEVIPEVNLTGVLHAVSPDSIIYVRAYMQYVTLLGGSKGIQ